MPPSLLKTLYAALPLLSCSLVSAVPSAGCSAPGWEIWGKNEVDQTLSSGRTYQIQFPELYDPADESPLIIAYHDRNQTVEAFKKMTWFQSSKHESKAIVVYPTAANGQWLSDGAAGLESNLKLPGGTDMQFTAALIDELLNTYCIDKDRIYAAGLGTGGGMTHLLACNKALSQHIAAFASIMGAFFEPSKHKESPWRHCEIGRRPIPFLSIHGTADEKWGYLPADKEQRPPFLWLKAWADKIGCGNGLTAQNVPGDVPGSMMGYLKHGRVSEGGEFGGGATAIRYQCNGLKKMTNLTEYGNLAMLHYALDGVGYGWPRQKLTAKKTVKIEGEDLEPIGEPYFDTTTVVHDWFKAHKLPSRAEMWTSVKGDMMKSVEHRKMWTAPEPFDIKDEL